MIHRTWSARAVPANIDAYLHNFHELVAPALKSVPGFLGATILQGADEGNPDQGVRLVVVTRWESMDAISRFAGEDMEAAVVEPAAAAVLIEYDRRVTHLTVISQLSR
jgi:heme-degrading monooxygenase HmoA